MATVLSRSKYLENMHFGVQLDKLRLLQDGWLDGFGQSAMPGAGLIWLREAFEYNAGFYPDELPVPHLYPTEAGGVHAEWSLDPNEITLDVNLGTRLGEWHVLNMAMSDDVHRAQIEF